MNINMEAAESVRLVEPISILPSGQQKLKLQLRRMSFSREISNMSGDFRQLHRLLLKNRSIRTECIYNSVKIWSRLLAIDPPPWTRLGFRSEHEYTLFYDLPDGNTLAVWTIMVQLFDRETFLLLGIDVLNFMIRWIGQYQPNSDLRKKDYQEIFTMYGRSHPDGFDKSSFYQCVRDYVDMKYEKPKTGKTNLLETSIWKTRRLNRKTNTVQTEVPITDGDLSWIPIECPRCQEKVTAIRDLLKYVNSLEEVLNRNKIPFERPDSVELIFKSIK